MNFPLMEVISFVIKLSGMAMNCHQDKTQSVDRSDFVHCAKNIIVTQIVNRSFSGALSQSVLGSLLGFYPRTLPPLWSRDCLCLT